MDDIVPAVQRYLDHNCPPRQRGRSILNLAFDNISNVASDDDLVGTNDDLIMRRSGKVSAAAADEVQARVEALLRQVEDRRVPVRRKHDESQKELRRAVWKHSAGCHHKPDLVATEVEAIRATKDRHRTTFKALRRVTNVGVTEDHPPATGQRDVPNSWLDGHRADIDQRPPIASPTTRVEGRLWRQSVASASFYTEIPSLPNSHPRPDEPPAVAINESLWAAAVQRSKHTGRNTTRSSS